MNRAQKQVAASALKSEADCIKDIQAAYQQALKDINAEIKRLSEREQTPSVAHQLQFQRQLQTQVSDIIEDMQTSQYQTISGYLNGCYEDGYIGALYDIQSQGVPVTVPIDQAQVTKAVKTDSKLSKSLYQSMGKYLKPLKKAITQELTRGLASSMHWQDIAANIERRSSIGWSNAIRIARTEGHRIQNAAKMDAMKAAKDTGADVVKQWDATLDGNTRKSHRELDGQIREIDEPFEVNGHKAMSPGHFGRPEEDINCRCTVLERARWALDEDELATLKERAEYFGLDKAKTFETFKERWMKAADYTERGRNPVVDKMADLFGKKHAEAIAEQMQGADEDVVRAWNEVQGDFKFLRKPKRGEAAHYTPMHDGVVIDMSEAASGSSIYKEYELVFHEYGHMADYLLNRKYGDQRYQNINRYKGISTTFQGLDSDGNPIIDPTANNGLLGRTAKAELKKAANAYKKEHGLKSVAEARVRMVRDLMERYSLLERANLSDIMEGCGNFGGYPLGAGHGTSYWKSRDNGVEIFAELTSASVNNPESLECIKELLPETYKVYKDIMKVVR